MVGGRFPAQSYFPCAEVRSPTYYDRRIENPGVAMLRRPELLPGVLTDDTGAASRTTTTSEPEMRQPEPVERLSWLRPADRSDPRPASEHTMLIAPNPGAEWP